KYTARGKNTVRQLPGPCNKQVSLAKLLARSRATSSWAIGRYALSYKGMLERSWVRRSDSVNVKSGFGETFGDLKKLWNWLWPLGWYILRPLGKNQNLQHPVDRLKFFWTYKLCSPEKTQETFGHYMIFRNRPDVLLCFSVNNPVSLRNCRLMWFPGNSSILSQHTSSIGRMQERFTVYVPRRSLSQLFSRSQPIRSGYKKKRPRDARRGQRFSERTRSTSVLTYYGVNEVFENAIRAALIARRVQRFWMTNLKKYRGHFCRSILTGKQVIVRMSDAGASLIS
ncbi:hypothetical protein NQ317_001252, partial [Molorchus minor]